MMTDFN